LKIGKIGDEKSRSGEMAFMPFHFFIPETSDGRQRLPGNKARIYLPFQAIGSCC
jgi:hypothetical protein